MGRIQHLTMVDLRRNPPKPVNSLWGQGLIVKPSLVHISAEQKVGKSLFAKQLLHALVDTSVTEWLGFSIATCRKVMYLNEEVPQSGVYNRMCIMYGEQPHTWDDAFVVPAERGLRIDSDPRMLYDTLEEHRPDVLCIDPWDRYHTCDTGSNQQMGILLDRAWHAARTFDAVFMFVHHWNKEGIGDMRSSFSRPRGAGRLTGDPDSNFTLTKLPDGVIQLDAQLRHGEWPGPVRLRRNAFMRYERVHGSPESHEEGGR